MATRRRYQFTKKKHSKLGILALVIAILLFVLFWALIGMAFTQAGQLSMYYGSLGMAALFLTLGDFILAICALREEETFRFFPRLAAIVSFVTLVCWIGIYVIGLIL